MIDFRLLNGNPKCTVIETFDNRGIILCGSKRLTFISLEEAKKHIVKKKLEINIEFIFGSSIKREIQKNV